MSSIATIPEVVVFEPAVSDKKEVAFFIMSAYFDKIESHKHKGVEECVAYKCNLEVANAASSMVLTVFMCENQRHNPSRDDEKETQANIDQDSAMFKSFVLKQPIFVARMSIIAAMEVVPNRLLHPEIYAIARENVLSKVEALIDIGGPTLDAVYKAFDDQRRATMSLLRDKIAQLSK